MISPSEEPGAPVRPSCKPSETPPAPADGTKATDTSNMFAVGVPGTGGIVIMQPPLPCQIITKAQALNLAAWLSVLADPDGKEFARIVQAIKNT